MNFMANFQTIISRRQVATICKVSERTAQRWISGTSKPKRAYMDLLYLHDNERIMPKKWPHGWRFNSAGYLDMGHKTALNSSQIEWYFHSFSCWRALLDLLPKVEARIDYLMSINQPSAVILDLQKYKDEIQRLKNREFAMPANLREYHDLEHVETHRKSGC